MKPRITLTIINPNDSAYPTIILRKFFNMVFIEPDGKTLHIYTATVFGGASDKNTAPKPYLDAKVRCALDFRYSVLNDKDEKVDSISFENRSESYVKQTEWIGKIWGDVKKLQTQNEIKAALASAYPNLYNTADAVNLPDVTKLGAVLSIQEKQKGPSSHHCIACCGEFEEKKGALWEYRLCTSVAAGIEAVNWIRTTIKLKTDILRSSEKVSFEVEFSDNTNYYTPDFTWYFAPPTNYAVDVETATLTIGDSSEEPNKVTSVADNTTVLFEEWDEQEAIRERKKARVNFREITATDNYILSGKRIKVTLSFINPEKHGNTQFILGLVVAFLLSFCSDKTRLNDFNSICQSYLCTEKLTENAKVCESALCNVQSCICSNICNFLGILFPVLIIMAFIAMSFDRKRCIPKISRSSERVVVFSRFLGLAATVFLACYIYLLWLVFPDFMKTIVPSCYVNQIVILLAGFISLVCNCIYVFYCGKIKKNKIIDFF